MKKWRMINVKVEGEQQTELIIGNTMSFQF